MSIEEKSGEKVKKMSVLDQLKKHTVIVADTGDFEGNMRTITSITRKNDLIILKKCRFLIYTTCMHADVIKLLQIDFPITPYF